MGDDKRCAEGNHAKNRDAVDMLEIRTETQACLHQLVDRVEEHDILGLITDRDKYTHTQASLHRGLLATMWDQEKELRDGLNTSLVAQMKAQGKTVRHDVDEKLAEHDRGHVVRHRSDREHALRGHARARIHCARSVCGREENGLAVQKLEVVTTFTMQGCEALTEKFEASFKGAAEMAKEFQAVPMGAEVEAEVL
jgi:hypothetical protein